MSRHFRPWTLIRHDSCRRRSSIMCRRTIWRSSSSLWRASTWICRRSSQVTKAGLVIRPSATTTEAVRRAIQPSQASLRALAKRYGINQKTVAKWKGRTSVADLPTGPKKPKSTVLTTEEEAVVVAFRRHTLLPLDDCLYALQPTIAHLTRSSLHRCLQRHGVSRLPQMEGDKEPRRTFKTYPIGFFHVDIAEVQTAQGKLYLFVAIDRTSKFAVAQLVH